MQIPSLPGKSGLMFTSSNEPIDIKLIVKSITLMKHKSLYIRGYLSTAEHDA